MNEQKKMRILIIWFSIGAILILVLFIFTLRKTLSGFKQQLPVIEVPNVNMNIPNTNSDSNTNSTINTNLNSSDETKTNN